MAASMWSLLFGKPLPTLCGLSMALGLYPRRWVVQWVGLGGCGQAQHVPRALSQGLGPYTQAPQGHPQTQPAGAGGTEPWALRHGGSRGVAQPGSPSSPVTAPWCPRRSQELGA